jgi:TPP-dependent pyruvate/acetoin dehydrogenase alpha subunit
MATGLALGDHYKKTDGVTICMFGDGATNIGYFHEALNLSKVWNLPVLWVCENNQYGMGTAVERASAVSEIRQKAEGYGIPIVRSMGWTSWKCEALPRKFFSKSGKEMGPISWKSSPIVLGGILWETLSDIEDRTK